MSLEDDGNRWERLLTAWHRLSQRRYSGSFTLHMHDGRWTRRSVEAVEVTARAAAPVDVANEVIQIQGA